MPSLLKNINETFVFLGKYLVRKEESKHCL